jgi:hypothetical protein
MDKAVAMTSGENLSSASSGENRIRGTEMLIAPAGRPVWARTGAAIARSPT